MYYCKNWTVRGKVEMCKSPITEKEKDFSMCNILLYLVTNQKIGYALVFEKAKNKSKTFGIPSFGILKTQTESNQRNDKFEHQSYHSTLHCTSLC